MVAGEERGHRIRVLPGEPGTALDIGKQKSDGSSRQYFVRAIVQLIHFVFSPGD